VGHDAILLKSNPLGKVPCLVMEGGEAVFDSRVIVEYLDTLSPVGKLIPPRGASASRCAPGRRWPTACSTPPSWRAWKQVWTGRSEAQRSQAWIDRQMSRVDSALVAMSKGLGDKPWCMGIPFTLADIAVGCALGYLDFRFPQIDWRERHPTWQASRGQQVGQQTHLVVGGAAHDVQKALISFGCFRPAACTSSFSASSVFWW
jgi:glutathione S-transferase